MYQHFDKKNIKILKKNKNEVFYLTSDNELYNSNNKIDIDDLIGFDLLNDQILIYKENLHTDIYDIKTKIRKTNKPYLIYPKYTSGINNIWSIIRRDNKKIWINSDLDFNNIKEFELPESLNKNFHYLFSKDKYISKNDKTIGCFDITGTKYWMLEYDELLINSNSKMYGNFQIIKNKLFFFLFDSSRQTDNNITFCVDIETGKTLWKSTEIGGWLTTHNEQIYNLHIKSVKRLNPETFEIETINLTEQLDILDKKQYDKANNFTWDIPFRFSTSKYVIDNDYLFFSQDKRNTIGIINLITKKLKWSIDIEIDNPNIQIITDIKVAGEKLYIFDSGNVLNIYKKENNL